MNIYAAAGRLILSIGAIIAIIAFVWLALEWGWDLLWDKLDALRGRAKRARIIADYQEVAHSHRRRIKA